ncbi:zinc finger protein 318-like [Motacilla alba alba]|uniref:zinc finger protein 318-like n=1 Tax=Motacilla alba alba TaxID=1094192 RepID=UPI0018D55C45|nr:zinc finger protein 318-like [Motacilla alba alba]XP_037992120.1 zinc finger protein 318-like [Motacilla alba alba]
MGTAMPEGSRRAGNQDRCLPSTVGCRRSGVRPLKGYSPGISPLARSVAKEGNVANKIKHKTKDRTCPTEPAGSAETQEPPASLGPLGCSAAPASGKVSWSLEAAVTETGERAASPPRSRENSPSPPDARNKPRSSTAGRKRDTGEGVTRGKAGCQRLPVPERDKPREEAQLSREGAETARERETKIPSEGGSTGTPRWELRHPVMGTHTL